ncbi:hypothetical protein [Lysobacter gummosus]
MHRPTPAANSARGAAVMMPARWSPPENAATTRRIIANTYKERV